jgi:hypothetical protein
VAKIEFAIDELKLSGRPATRGGPAPKRESRSGISRQARLLSVALLTASSPQLALADEASKSFWLPGQYGSFAAIAPDGGFSLPLVSYYFSGSSSHNVALPAGHSLDLGLAGTFFTQILVPTYTPDVAIFGGKASFSVAILPAYSSASVSAQLGSLSHAESQSVTGFGDLYPTAKLFWNSGVSNWMAYVTGDIPVGLYNSANLANIGIGHAAVDFGGAYTFLDPTTGWEASATAGLTVNFTNPTTNYTSGVDAHLDWGVAKFLTPQFTLGAAGFFYRQLTPDRGQPAALGSFESQTMGIGPQIGYNFKAGGATIFTNLRAYAEFDTKNRVPGGSAFLTINLPISELVAHE